MVNLRVTAQRKCTMTRPYFFDVSDASSHIIIRKYIIHNSLNVQTTNYSYIGHLKIVEDDSINSLDFLIKDTRIFKIFCLKNVFIIEKSSVLILTAYI